MGMNPAFHERNTNISIRISPNFKLGVMSAAKDMGVSITDYVENCITAFEHEKAKTKECAVLQAKVSELEKQNAIIAQAFEPLFKKAQTSEAPIFKNSRPATMTEFLVMVAKTVKL